MFEIERRLQLHLGEQPEVYLTEEGMLFDGCSSFATSKSFFGLNYRFPYIELKQPPQKRFCLIGEIFRKGDGLVSDVLEDLMFVFAVEWRFACEHIIDD